MPNRDVSCWVDGNGKGGFRLDGQPCTDHSHGEWRCGRDELLVTQLAQRLSVKQAEPNQENAAGEREIKQFHCQYGSVNINEMHRVFQCASLKPSYTHLMQEYFERRRMSRVDSAWLHMDTPTNLMMIVGVLTFDEPMDWDRLRTIVRERLVARFDRFRMRPDNRHKRVGTTFWESDPNFDLENHITEMQLATGSATKQQLEQFVGELMSQSLDAIHPLWHLFFIDNYGEGCAVVVRMHHAFADGITLARVLISLTDPDVAGEQLQGLPIKQQGGRNSLREALGGDADADIFGRFLDYSRIASDSAAAFNKLVLSSSDTPNPFRGALSAQKLATWSEPFRLADVKRVGEQLGGTINDVLLTALTGALRRYLIEANSLVEEIRVAVPVNLRPLDGEIKLGNQFGLIFLPLPVGEADITRRLAKLHAAMNQIKRSPEALIAYGLLALIGSLPPALERRVMKMFASKASAVFTNVPGPRGTIYLAGVPLKELMFWVPQSGGLGLGISIISYNGGVQLGVTADGNLIKNPHELVRDFEIEFADLLGRV